MSEPEREDPIIQLARTLAAGQEPGPLLTRFEEPARARVAEVARVLGERILDLERREARVQSTLIDLRMALKGYTQVKRKLREENEGLRAAIDPGLRPIIGAEAGGGLAGAMQLVEKVLDTPIPVLITGESGTGKEVFARYIHDHGARADGPFVAVNCAALPETLLESELFGIERGVATGVGERPGKFVEADGGTLFLDEVADMSLAMQAKILRALQEHEVVRVGGRAPVKVDVRVVTATNKDLEAEIAAKRFRKDLYYRLVGVHVHLPALRERRRDIDALLDHFLKETARRFNRPVKRFSPEALAALRSYAWPGNVRELIVEVERAVALADSDIVEMKDLTPRVAAAAAVGGGIIALAPAAPPAGAVALAGAAPGAAAGIPVLAAAMESLRDARRRFEKAFIEMAIARAGGSRRRAAKLLGLTREGLRKKLHALGFPAGMSGKNGAEPGPGPGDPAETADEGSVAGEEDEEAIRVARKT